VLRLLRCIQVQAALPHHGVVQLPGAQLHVLQHMLAADGKGVTQFFLPSMHSPGIALSPTGRLVNLIGWRIKQVACSRL
jgi:hypothetical protein